MNKLSQLKEKIGLDLEEEIEVNITRKEKVKLNTEDFNFFIKYQRSFDNKKEVLYCIKNINNNNYLFVINKNGLNYRRITQNKEFTYKINKTTISSIKGRKSLEKFINKNNQQGGIHNSTFYSALKNIS